MTTLALISDQHITKSSRWEEGLRVLDWIAGELAARQPDVIALGGDLFDARPNSEEWLAAARWLLRLADIAPVVGVYGNHDPASSLAVFPHLRSRHPIAIYDTPAVHRVADAAILCLPWGRKANLLAALGREASAEHASQVAVEALRGILLGLGAELQAHAGPRVFLGHCMVRGSRMSTGQPLVGADMEVGLEDLALARADAYLFGHVHCPNRFDVMGAPGVMPGSPRRTAFGETEDKTIAWISIGNFGVQVQDIVTPATPMLMLAAAWDAESAQLAGDDISTPVAGAEVRLRYSVCSDQREAAKTHASEFKRDALARGAVHVQIEEVVDVVSRARAPEVAAAVTLPDKLSAFWKMKGVELSEARRERVFDKLRELEGEAP